MTHSRETLGIPEFLAEVTQTIHASLNFSERSGSRVRSADGDTPLAQTAALEPLIRRLVDAGGKLFRPKLVLLGYLVGLDAGTGTGPHSTDTTCRVCTDSPRPQSLTNVAAAFELLHLFGLLQDDVMDNSATRRGRSTAHHYVAASMPRARADGATGGRLSQADAERVGESIAVLAGDLAFSLASRLVRRVPEPVSDAWDATVIELVQGQRLDLVLSADGTFDEGSTLRVADAKSGSYSISRPLEMGALLAGLPQAPAWLREYGHSLGRAFALIDDIIGIWGNPQVTGKPVGEDLIARKPSTVIGIARRVLPSEMEGFFSAPNDGVASPEVATLIDRFEAAGVRTEAMTRTKEHHAEALRRVRQVKCPVLRTALGELADNLASRRS